MLCLHGLKTGNPENSWVFGVACFLYAKTKMPIRTEISGSGFVNRGHLHPLRSPGLQPWVGRNDCSMRGHVLFKRLFGPLIGLAGLLGQLGAFAGIYDG